MVVSWHRGGERRLPPQAPGIISAKECSRSHICVCVVVGEGPEGERGEEGHWLPVLIMLSEI